MFSESELKDFGVVGHLRVEGVLDADEIEAMRDRLWRQIERHDVDRNDPSTWSDRAVFGLQKVRDRDPDPNTAPKFIAALDQLMGEDRWRTKDNWGQALVTFPTDEPWTVPGGSWHLDHGYTYPPDEVWGVNVFLLVDDLEERGGGTGVVEGSPELIRRWVGNLDPAKSTQKQLRRGFEAKHPYFDRLVDRADATARPTERVAEYADTATVIDGVDVRVVEVTGRAGDVVICHPWALHNGTPNTADRPRLMRACRAYHPKLYDKM